MSGFDDAETVARRTARLRALLGAADGPAGPVAFPSERVARAARGRARRRALLVAVVALAAVGVVGVSPLRAWIVSAARTVWTRLVAPPRPAVPPATGPAPLAAEPVGAVTVPAGDSFTLTIARRQAAGTVTVVAEDRQTVSAEVAGDSGTAELQVVESGIRIDNRPGASAAYTVRVPARLSRLTVRVGGDAPRTVRLAPAQRWVLDLAVRTGGRPPLQD